MSTRRLAAEMREAVEGLTEQQRADLLAYNIPPNLIGRYRLIGSLRIKVAGSLYERDPEGAPAFITPALIDNPLTPESADPISSARVLGHLVDLVAWHPRRPDRWALRAGVATWLGCVEPQYMGPPPAIVHRTPLAWLRAGCNGLVLLTPEPLEVYRVLSGLQSIVAEDPQHAAALRAAMRRPWPLPKITAAAGEAQRAA